MSRKKVTKKTPKKIKKNKTTSRASRSSSSIVKTSRAPEPVGAYPHARRVGELLFLSGVGPRKAGSKEIPGVHMDVMGNVLSYDIAVQTEAVIKNVQAILQAAGSSLDRVVDVQVFLTDMKRDFKTYNEIYGKYFSKVQATRTTIEVGALPTPIAVEFKVIALA